MPAMRLPGEQILKIAFERYIYRCMAILERPQTDELDDALKALANPVRRQMLAWMKDPARHFPGQEHSYEFGVCAKKIDERLGLSQSTVSAHLAVMQHAGLITARRIGQFVFHKRNEPAIAGLLARMAQSL